MNDASNRLYVHRYDDYLAKCNYNYHVDKTLGASEIENGVILPLKPVPEKPGYLMGGVCDKDFNFIAAMRDQSKESPDWFGCHRGYKVSEDEIVYSDETVLYGGLLFGHIGHLITECLPARLWWHVKNPHLKIKIVFILHGEVIYGKETIHNMLNEFFSLLNIEEDRVIFAEKPMRFSKVIVPEDSVNMDPGIYHDEYSLVFEKIRENVEPAKYDKIYLSRAKYNFNNIMHRNINEDYFEDFYRGKGYEIISLEKYSVKDKIALIMGAKDIAAIFGTNSCFAMFAKMNVKLTMLCTTDADIPPNEQFLINQARSTDYYFITVSLNFLPQNPAVGNCIIGPTDYWKKFVEYYYNETIEETPEEYRKKGCYEYVKDWIEFYSIPMRFRLFRNIDNFEMINEMHRTMFGTELDRTNYVIGATKIQMQKQISTLTSEKGKLVGENKKFVEQNKKLDDEKRKLADEKKNLIDEKEKLINEKKKLVDEQNKALERQNALFAEKLERITNSISALSASITEISHKNDMLASELARENSRSKQREHECERLKNKIAEMENSRSWKITKPLRSIMWFFRRLFRKDNKSQNGA